MSGELNANLLNRIATPVDNYTNMVQGQQAVAQNDFNLENQQKEAHNKEVAAKAEKVASTLYGAKDPNDYKARVEYLKSPAGGGIEFDPGEDAWENRGALQSQAMTLAQHIAQGKDARDFAFDQTKFQADQAYKNKSFNADEAYRGASLDIERQKLAQGQQPKPEGYQVIGEDQFGKKQYGYPPAPGAMPQTSAQPIPQPMGQGQPNVMDLHGDEFIGQLDPKIGSQVRAIIEGRAAYPTGMLLKTPYGQQLAAYVTQADPTFESANATARAKVQADFATGTISKTNNALNTAIKHMKQMSDSVDDLKNYGQKNGYGVLNRTINATKNAVLTESGDPRVTNFKSISGKVAEELTRAYRGAGGAEADISRELEILQSSNSPEQLHSAIAKMAELLRSKIEANEAQYQSVMGPLVKHRPMISKEAQEALDVISGRAGNADSAAPADGEVDPALEDALSKYQ